MNLVKPVEQLKHGSFALMVWHNETTCGRHVYSSESQREWERRKKWEGRWETEEVGCRKEVMTKSAQSEVKEKRWDTEEAEIRGMQ